MSKITDTTTETVAGLYGVSSAHAAMFARNLQRAQRNAEKRVAHHTARGTIQDADHAILENLDRAADTHGLTGE